MYNWLLQGKEQLRKVMMHNPVILELFDPILYRAHGKELSTPNAPLPPAIASNGLYAVFVEEVLKRSHFKQFEKGDFVCHKGDVGKEMYVILEGDIGIFIEKNTNQVEESRKRISELIRKIMPQTDTDLSEEMLRAYAHIQYEKFD
jgi:hypothetical protein